MQLCTTYVTHIVCLCRRVICVKTMGNVRLVKFHQMGMTLNISQDPYQLILQKKINRYFYFLIYVFNFFRIVITMK